MPKVNDIKAYWREIAGKAGLGDDELKQVTAVLDNDKFAKALTDNFKPLPDYSHDLDDVRNKTKAEKDREYQEWYSKEQQKYNEWQAGLNELEWYRQNHGQQNPNPNKGEGVMTQEDIDKLVDAKLQTVLGDTLKRRDKAVIDLMEVREFHASKFKSALDVNAFEAAWNEHPEWGGSMKQAYREFMAPKLKEMDDAERTAQLEARYQEGVRDGHSRKAVPTDHQSKTFSPLFDRKEEVVKLSERDQEDHSRSAFFEGLREAK